MKYLLFVLGSLMSTLVFSQSISPNRVVSTEELADLLKLDIQQQFKVTNSASEAELAAYFRQKFSERFFYNYLSVEDRLRHYNQLYEKQAVHQTRALDHLSKYADSTKWILPFNYLTGEPVNAYALRHLARQHKMVDIAFHYFNDEKDPKYIQYFEQQMQSLNAALHANQYEKIENGNGVYEAFRAGYRVLNWLWIHHLFLNEEEYSDKDQLLTIATLLQHGQHLYENNSQFRSGNHQTRGVSALAMLAILLSDFKGTDLWLERAMLRLGEHLEQEINTDGFQFERSVHYHMSDINNYFYVYQLAKINDIEIDKAWKEKLQDLFTTLAKIAYPNRHAPVLQDDTEIPWAETNDISGAMTLGYLLFENPEFGYFASDKVDDKVYWFLSNHQLQLLENIHQKRPTYGSIAFEDTGYFIMREGWEESDKMMIISAGLDPKKPDHQHGDMLGIQAMANGHAILPNYQVRYSLKDFDLFKNSMVKNVALVDDELQGKEWTSNKGGSGFGKFKQLPHPNVITWESNDVFDYFAGSHDGFEDIDVQYTRQVIFIKNEFWIVKDAFQATESHEYKQVWQGHYTDENGPNLLRAIAPDASGHDILQLHKVDSVWSTGTRGKHWSVVSSTNQQDFNFLTIIYPFKGYHNRLDEDTEEIVIKDWTINQSEWKIEGKHPSILHKDNQAFLFDITTLQNQTFNLQASETVDLFIQIQDNQTIIQSLNIKKQPIIVTLEKTGEQLTKVLGPGQTWIVR